jgi:hypothetical protein
MNENPKTKPRLKSRSGRKKIPSTSLSSVAAAAHPLKTIKSEKNPSNANGSCTQ